MKLLVTGCSRKSVTHITARNGTVEVMVMRRMGSSFFNNFKNFAHCLPICSIVNFKVHICMNPNFMVHTRIDRFCYVTEHDLSSAQAIIDFFFLNLLMNILLEITVNHKLYYLNCLSCHRNLIIRNDCFNFQVYRR